MFEPWWDHAADNYVTWQDGRPVAMDLYYDPVVDEHVSSPMGLMAPVWYLAPQRPDVALSAWELAVEITGLSSDKPPTADQPGLLADPAFVSLLALQTGEFDDGLVRDRIWEVIDGIHEPTSDNDLGEFTYGFGLDEPHPRGQLNARTMAGWVCTPGAWSRIFNAGPGHRFTDPTVGGVDFPDVALSEARWDSPVLYLAAQPRSPSVAGRRNAIRVTALPIDGSWTLLRPDGTSEVVDVTGGGATLEIVVDGGGHQLHYY